MWFRTDLADLHTSPDVPKSLKVMALDAHRHSRRESWCQLQKRSLQLRMTKHLAQGPQLLGGQDSNPLLTVPLPLYMPCVTLSINGGSFQ